MKIIFVRHGDTNYNTGKLTLKGIFQAKNAIKYIGKEENISAIFCSSKTRTLQTANIINKFYKVPMHISKEFNEREQLSPKKQAFKKDFDDNYMNYEYENKNFETCKEFIDRNFSGLEKIKRKFKNNQTVLLVAHSSTLYAINAYVNGIPESKQIKWWQCSNGAVIKFNI